MSQRRCEYCGSLEVEPIRRFVLVDTEKCRNCGAPMPKPEPPRPRGTPRFRLSPAIRLDSAEFERQIRELEQIVNNVVADDQQAIAFTTSGVPLRVRGMDLRRSAEMVEVTCFGDTERKYMPAVRVRDDEEEG